MKTLTKLGSMIVVSVLLSIGAKAWAAVVDIETGGASEAGSTDPTDVDAYTQMGSGQLSVEIKHNSAGEVLATVRDASGKPLATNKVLLEESTNTQNNEFQTNSQIEALGYDATVHGASVE